MDIRKVIVTFRNFVNASKSHSPSQYHLHFYTLYQAFNMHLVEGRAGKKVEISVFLFSVNVMSQLRSCKEFAILLFKFL